MTRATLLALADRVEALTGPCRETDAEIGRYAPHLVAFLGGVPDGPQYNCLRYTASLDAARTLVPGGMVWNAGNDAGCWAHVWCDKRLYDGVPHLGHAATEPLALTAAALRARAMMETDHE